MVFGDSIDTDNHMVSGSACAMDLSIVSGGSIDHGHKNGCCISQGHQHGLRWQHRLWTSTLAFRGDMAIDIRYRTMDLEEAWALTSPWSQVAVQDTHINIAPGVSMAHGDQHDFRLQPRPRTFTWPSVVSWSRDINTDPSCCRTSDIHMNLGHHPSHGLQAKCGPQMSFEEVQSRKWTVLHLGYPTAAQNQGNHILRTLNALKHS